MKGSEIDQRAQEREMCVYGGGDRNVGGGGATSLY